MQTIALRELFQAKAGNTSSEFLSRGSTREIKASQDSELSKDIQLKNEEDTEIEIQKMEEIRKTEKDAPFTEEKPSSGHASLMGINDASDEFFDVPEAYSDHMENDWSLEVSPELQPLVLNLSLQLISTFQKKLLKYKKLGFYILPQARSLNSYPSAESRSGYIFFFPFLSFGYIC